MQTVYFDIDNNIFFLNGEQVTDKAYTFHDGAVCDILCFPRATRYCYLPIFTKLKFSKKPNLPNDFFTYVDYGNSVYKILSIPKPAELSSDLEIFYSNTFDLSDTYHNVTITKGNGLELFIETENYFFKSQLPPLNSVAVDILSEVDLIFITGKTKEKEFLLVVKFDGDYTEELRVECDKLIFAEDGIYCTDHISNSHRHTKTTIYSLNDSAKYSISSEQFSVAQKNHNPLLIPYLFLDAVKAGDSALANSYLSSDMHADSKAFIRFFDNFEKIADDEFLKPEADEVYLIIPNENYFVCKKYVFCLQNNLITNISC